MACKIQIRQNITAVVEERTNPVMDSTLERARSVANAVNDDFGVAVVSFSKAKTGELERRITIPNTLVDEYYDNEVDLEEQEEEDEIEDGNVSYQFKAVKNITDNLAKVNGWFKQMKDSDQFWQKVQQDLQIPKDQIVLLRNTPGDTIEEKLVSFAANYSFTVETKTVVESSRPYGEDINKGFSQGNYKYWVNYKGEYIKKEKGEGIYDNASGRFIENPQQIITKEEYETAFNITTPTQHYSNLTVPGGTNYTENEIATPDITPNIPGHARFATEKGIGWFRSDEDLGEPITSENLVIIYDEDGEDFAATYDEINYEGKRIPVLLIGQTREEVQEQYDALPDEVKQIQKFTTTGDTSNLKVRRILELQSDLFQKGREREDLHKREDQSKQWGWFDVGGYRYRPYNIDLKTYIREDKNNLHKTEYITKEQHDEALAEFEKDTKENQFLQLLNKSHNWVTFFVKSIIQDSARKAYETVLFPSGDTASKIEGHATLEEFKKEKEDRIKILEKKKFEVRVYGTPYKAFETMEEAERYAKKHDETEIRDVSSISEREMAQLKQELERVETEGMAALKPIHHFYEEVVANVLRKQGYNPQRITDENGNEWNQVTIDDSRDKAPIMLQLDDMKASRAAQVTLDKIKGAAEKMGINIQKLDQYAKEHPEMDYNGVAGLADLIKGTVAIAQGREGVALTEEIVHIATAIIEQSNPKLMTQLISQIGKYKIYDEVFKAYKGNKLYQLSDGKPDIRKIKKEAVDKLIAELIIHQSEGSTEFPELMQKKSRDEVKGWWDSILNFIQDLFQKGKVDLFEQTAKEIAEGNVGSASDITTDGIYLQIKPNTVVNEAYNRFVEEDENLVLNDADKADRHYMYKGDTRVGSTVTEDVKKGKTMPTRTPDEEAVDEQKMAWGDNGHIYMKDELLANFLDEDGYALETPLDNPIKTNLDPKIARQLRNFARKLIASYPKGTRFLIERKVINKNVKGLLASTVDFKALVPTKAEDGTDDMFVDTLDWKFTTIDKDYEEDIPWFKQSDWKPQMEHYITMDHVTYGVEPHQTRLSRMIPFILTYQNTIKKDPKSPIRPVSIEIGKLDSTKETNMYLLPVPVGTESTGNESVDHLVQALQSQWDKLWEKYVPEGFEKQKKILDLNQLSAAIRNLHLKLNFTPLRDVGLTFLENARGFIKDLHDVKIDELSRDELNSLLADVVSYKDSAIKYADIDQVFLSQYPAKGLNKEGKETLKTFRELSRQAVGMQDDLEAFEKLVVRTLAVQQGIVSEKNSMSILEAEAAIDVFSKAFKESSKLPSKIINLATRLIMVASELTNRRIANQIKEFGKILLPLEEEASAKGKRAFDMIARMDKGKMELIKKLAPEFWKNVEKAKKDRDKKFLKQNLNMEEYVKDVKEAIEKAREDLKKRQYDVDEKTANEYRENALERLKNNIDIRRPNFNGWDTKSFSYYFNKNIKEEGNLSDEYKGMSENARKVWNFFTELNKEARKVGYLGDQGASFFPLIEATTIDKFNQTSDFAAQTKDFFKDFYTMTVNEENQFSKIDPETGKVKQQIPKFFTKTNKSVEQLSTDLNKVGSLWIQALHTYKTSKEMEYTLMTLDAVERGKGSLVLENGVVAMSKGKKVINYSDVTNANILKTVMDDFLYNLTENVDSFGNVKLASLTEKFSADEESKQKNVVAVKKVIKNADTLVQALAVGLKPLISFANWMGGQFQAYINSGNMYTWSEYWRNNLAVSTGNLDTIERGLLDLIMPLNEDIALEERRKLAKKQGLAKYLSTWTFTDVMMSTNSFPEKRLQWANALSFNENSMVRDGEIVNIRQFLKKQDSKKKYEKDAAGKYVMSDSQRKALEDTFEDRVSALKASSSLVKIARIENDEVIIPGVTEEALARYTLTVKEYQRELNGQMSSTNKADYRRDTMFASFMMFKNWIPKLLSVRTLDLQKNLEMDEWQYGRARAFLKTAVYLGKNTIGGMQDIIEGNEKGLKVLEDLLEAKRADHFRKTGQKLEITQEDFNDVMRIALENQVKELKLLLGILAVVFAAGAALPPEEATDQEKNLYKHLAKAINKVADEVTFYYNPISFETMTSGRMLPSIGILSKVFKIIQQVGKEGYAIAADDEEMAKKAHGLKYTLNIIPGLAQFMTEVLPFLYPELAKEMGVRVTEQSRRQ